MSDLDSCRPDEVDTCQNCEQPTDRIFVTDDDVELCEACYREVPIERHLQLVERDPETGNFIARHTIVTAARSEDDARDALASAVQLTAQTWPPRKAQAPLADPIKETRVTVEQATMPISIAAVTATFMNRFTMTTPLSADALSNARSAKPDGAESVLNRSYCQMGALPLCNLWAQ